jgi:hypothetical protein
MSQILSAVSYFHSLGIIHRSTLNPSPHAHTHRFASHVLCQRPQAR